MNAATSKSNDLEKRLISFAALTVRFSAKLPQTPQGGIYPAKFCALEPRPPPITGESRGAESRADFIHKLKVVFKELNETTIWLEVIGQSSLLSAEEIVAIIAENREPCRIIGASIKTARSGTE